MKLVKLQRRGGRDKYNYIVGRHLMTLMKNKDKRVVELRYFSTNAFYTIASCFVELQQLSHVPVDGLPQKQNQLGSNRYGSTIDLKSSQCIGQGSNDHPIETYNRYTCDTNYWMKVIQQWKHFKVPSRYLNFFYPSFCNLMFVTITSLYLL